MKDRIIVRGKGKEYESQKEYLEQFYEVIAVLDSEYSLDAFHSEDYDYVYIASTKYEDEIRSDLLSNNIDDCKIITFFSSKLTYSNYKKSYSQTGEDLIVKFIFDALGIEKPSYIDIGAHDPSHLSNTAIFYNNGSRGVNIEPNSVLYGNIKKARKDDINLNIGIGSSNEVLDFFVMNSPTMSTFSREEAEDLVNNHNFKIVDVRKVPLMTIEHVIDKYCNGCFPDFLSLDAEGLDYAILQSIDFDKHGPTVICVETIEYSESLFGCKDNDIIDFLQAKGYMIFADTHINTIFLKKELSLLLEH